MKKVLYAWLVMVGFFVLTSCSQWFYTEEGECSKRISYRDFRKTFFEMNGTRIVDSTKRGDVTLTLKSSFPYDSDPITYEINVKNVKSVFMDIYGCQNMYCDGAEKIIFRDDAGSYKQTLNTFGFSFGHPAIEPVSEEFGTDCSLEILNFFDLKISTDNIKIDWTVQESEEVCDVTFYY